MSNNIDTSSSLWNQLNEPSSIFLLAGPCVVESVEVLDQVASELTRLRDKYGISIVLKSSYRKANRSRIDSFTGIGDEKALEILSNAGQKYGLPTVTDIHTDEDAAFAAKYVDVLQIPAFLCRQTSLLIAAAKTGKIINIKKGQFLSPDAMQFAKNKVIDSGNDYVLLTERGTTFGYNDLVVDIKSIPIMKRFGVPVVMDVTHALQKPNQTSGVTGGQPEFIKTLAAATVAAGVDGLFIETHPDPSKALSDGANMLPLDQLDDLLGHVIKIKRVISE